MMKNRPFYLICIIVLGLNSCSSLNGNVLDITPEQDNYLVYQIVDYPGQRNLYFYDPTSDVRTSILTEWEIYGYSVSTDNRLAFSSTKEGNSNIYVLDYPFTENAPTKITFDTFTNSPLSWSSDGHYLLLEREQADSKRLSIWNGKNFLDIYSYHGKISEITWSNNGQLAFTEFFINDPSRDRCEVYVWDGKDTFNVSQNPSGEDRFPAWSKDGQLAFLSERNEEYDIFVWDGTSKDNGLPDINSFTNIAPDLTQYFSNPIWTNSNSIAFTAGSESDVHVQIYEWDGQSAKNISQNPASHNGGQTWSNDGFWSFITFFSSSQNLYIRDSLNQTVLETKGQYRPAWSQNGLLAFCVPERPDWMLSIWNGESIVEIANGNFIVAKWNNGEYVFCSNG